eukprot:1895384-Amphidinium_carterae.1
MGTFSSLASPHSVSGCILPCSLRYCVNFFAKFTDSSTEVEPLFSTTPDVQALCQRGGSAFVLLLALASSLGADLGVSGASSFAAGPSPLGGGISSSLAVVAVFVGGRECLNVK